MLNTAVRWVSNVANLIIGAKNTVWSTQTRKHTKASQKLDKRKGSLPVYIQLAGIIRKTIATGKLKPGNRIPPESKLAEQYGVSPMTVRQAVSVLVEEKLVKRVHGSGTYVSKVEVGATSFGLGGLNEILSDTDHLDVQILKSDIERVQGTVGQHLRLKPGDPAILVERLIHYRNKAFALQVAYLPFDPLAPVVEDMLDTSGLSGLFVNKNPSGYKKGSLRLLPLTMDERNMEILMSPADNHAFKLEYIYYNFKDRPCAYGWFIIPHENLPIVSRIGVWND
jgi:GntR family transcriptional regulator